MNEQQLEQRIAEDFTKEEVIELASIVNANRLTYQGYVDFLKLCAGWRRLHAEVERLHTNVNHWKTAHTEAKNYGIQREEVLLAEIARLRLALSAYAVAESLEAEYKNQMGGDESVEPHERIYLDQVAEAQRTARGQAAKALGWSNSDK